MIARTRLDRLAATAAPRIDIASAPVRAWYDARSAREQRLLAVLGAVAAAVLLVVAVVRPLQAARTRALADIRAYELLAAELRAAGPISPEAARRRSRADLATAIPAAAQALGLTIQRIEPEGTRTRVALTGVPFEALMGFLAELDGEGVPVAEARIDRQAEPGRVDAQLLLGR